MQNEKHNYIQKLSKLSAIARNGSFSFPDELCKFIVDEFDLNLNAAVIFSLKADSTLSILGKAGNHKENILYENYKLCYSCPIIKNILSHRIDSNPTCSLHISDSAFNEYCVEISSSAIEKIFLRIACKKVFTSDEKELFETSLHIISIAFSHWITSSSKLNKSTVSFSKIVAETSSELKANSNSIIGFLSYLVNESPTTSQLEYISAIKKNAQSILLNINDLGELSKIDNDSSIESKKEVDIILLANEILDAYRKSIGTRKIEFILDADRVFSKPISIDEQKFRYILTMLLFVSTTITLQGSITININVVDNKKFRILISDSGKQFDQETLNNIFEPFYLSHQEDFKNTNITGLSLTLVRSFVHYLGGEINVTNNKDAGNTFVYTISGDIMTDIESSLSKLPKPTTMNKVLVIEDDYATSKLLSNYLNKWGYDPLIVSSDIQAMNAVENESFLAVILDIELPNINGLELLKHIHEHPKTKNIPVIVCSVEPEQQKAFLMGAVEYFVKPINYNYLVEVLTSYKLRKNSNILCVDDDLPTLNLVKQAIEQAGFVAVAINDSTTVIDSIKDKEIDLAIVDLDMPGLNGFQLIKLIKSNKRYEKLPIIIYTGKENYSDDLKQIEGLFEDLLDKRSTNMEDLADTINAMINRYETPPPVEEVKKKEGGLKILLAEDYKHSQIIVTRLLKKNGFEDVVVVENGEDAVNMSKEQNFDLILMDMQMPIMNGFDATEKIREFAAYKNTPIIALTAFAMKGDREKCIEAGATDYIPKPIDSKEFIEKVKYYTNTLG